MKYILLALAFLSIQEYSKAQKSPVTDSLTIRTLTKEEMQADFNYLRKILEETHPALYRYTPKAVFQKEMDSIYNLLNVNMPFYDYYKLLTSLIVDIRCAHTSIVPTKNFGEYFAHGMKMLPFEIIPVDNHLYITANATLDTTIHSGDEILSIDGRDVNTIMQQLKRHIWSDGYNETSKIEQIRGIRFGFWYYMMVDRPDSFLLRLRNQDGKEFQITAPAMLSSIYEPNFYKNPVNKAIIAANKERNQKEQKEGWRLEILQEPSTALIRINGFGGGENGDEAAEKMRKFMEKNIATLKKKKIQNLIVDLRYNGGGWDIQGVELFTYLMKDTTPVRYYRRKHTITDSSEFIKFSDLSPEERANVKQELIPETDGTFTLKEQYTEDLKLQYPKPQRFTGNMYFLINGGTGSSASEFVAVAHSYGLGKFIGTESGGAYEGDNGGSFLHFELPNSGISVGTPLIYYNNGVKEPILKGRGVIPDYPVQGSIEDILNGRDRQLEFALQLIRNKK